MAFPVPGVQVNLARSNGHDVFIRPRELQASGIYKCKVIVENTFRSALSKEKYMEVVQAKRRANSSFDNQLLTSAWNQQQRFAPNQRKQPSQSAANQQHLESRNSAPSSGAVTPTSSTALLLGPVLLLLLPLTSRPFVRCAL